MEMKAMAGSFLSAWMSSGLEAVPPAPAAANGEAALESIPVVVWSASLPGEAPNVAAPTEPGAPAVIGNHIFLGASGASALFVLDRGNGSVVDEIPTRAPLASAPLVLREDLVLFADAAGYTQRWSKRAGAWKMDWEHYSGAPVVNSPVLIDGVVYVTNVDELVFALDAETGFLRWRYEHRLDAARSVELELFGAPQAAVTKNSVYVGFSDGFLVSLNRATGTEEWNAAVGEGTYPDLIAPALPLPDGAVLVAGYSEPLLHLDPQTRTPSWRLDFGSAAAPALVGSVIFQPGSDGKLRKVDARTGAVVWTWDSGSTGPLLTPELTGAGVLVASTDSTVFLLDPDTGAERWRLSPPGVHLTGFASRPAVVGGDVYAVSNGGTVYALRGTAARAKSSSEPYVRSW